jgi:hypothetical protein
MKFKLDQFPVAEERGYHRRIGTDGCRSARPAAVCCHGVVTQPIATYIGLRGGDNVKIIIAYNRDSAAITSYIERTRQ